MLTEGREEQKIRVMRPPDIKEINFSHGQALQFAATVETAPEFRCLNIKDCVWPWKSGP